MQPLPMSDEWTDEGAIAPFDYVIFGATGDLSLRKLMVSLFRCDASDQFSPDSRVVGASRSQLSPDAFRDKVRVGLETHLRPGELCEPVWERFAARLVHVSIDATDAGGFTALRDALGESDHRTRVFYLATAPALFGQVCHGLRDAGLVDAASRVVLEKPLGHDLDSSRRINREVGEVFDEQNIYRIDHYLGKESVQNLLALRFANSLFEPLWNAGHIDHVQITVAETVGLEGRGGYYERAGALRDMVQNHLLQLLCLVAIEPPNRLGTDSVRDEKLKVLQSLRPITDLDLAASTVHGQYTAGANKDGAVVGYLDEQGVAVDSATETFVALRIAIDNWRWAGVPFYLRTGKRLPQKVSEIVIQFRDVPHSIYPASAGAPVANRLVVRLQPDEAVRLHMMTKAPDPHRLRLREAPLNLSFAETFSASAPEAYERLLMDVVRGNPTLFMRRDEVEAAWIWTQAIISGWERQQARPRPYMAGTWGPSAAVALIERDGRSWHE